MSALATPRANCRSSPIIAAAVLASWSTTTAQSPTLEHVLALHVEHLGGKKAVEALGDFVIEATLQMRQPTNLRTFVRRQPFAIRQEIQDAASDQPYVRISDGRHAWRVLPDGTTTMLTGIETRILLEAAWVDGLQYLQGSTVTAPMMRGPQQQLAMPPGVPNELQDGTPVWPVAVMLPCGSELRLYFDSKDGALRGLANSSFAPQRNVRYGEVAPFADLRWPAVRFENQGISPPLHVQIDAVRQGPLDASLFPNSPLAPLARIVDAGPLLALSTEIPGSCYFVVPEVAIDERIRVPALLDTGAGRSYLDARLADQLALPVLSQRRTRGITGMADVTQRWLESLALPGFRLAQIEVGAALLPPTTQMVNGTWPGAILGGEVLARGPVLDVWRGRLFVRGSPIAPLQGADVLTVPLTRSDDLHVIPIDLLGTPLDVVLDSGMAVPLRLSAKDLKKAGLPTDASAWLARGAVPLETTGAGQGSRHDLLAQIDAFRLGTVVFERPWVLLALDTKNAGAFAESALGAGALAVFDLVGIDLDRTRLELEPGKRLERTKDGWRAPPAGTFLGLRVVLDQRQDGGPADGLVVVEVSPGTPAATAGIQPGDRVLSIDGERCAGDLQHALIERLWAPAGACSIDVRGKDGVQRHLVLSR